MTQLQQHQQGIDELGENHQGHSSLQLPCPKTAQYIFHILSASCSPPSPNFLRCTPNITLSVGTVKFLPIDGDASRQENAFSVSKKPNFRQSLNTPL